MTSLFLAHSSPITVIIPDDIYHGVPTVLHNVFQRHNVQLRRVDMSKVSNIVSEISNHLNTTDDDADNNNNKKKKGDIIVWIETPSNPLCKVFDIYGICQAIDSLRSNNGTNISNNITTVVDVTMASPVVTRPLEVRVDCRCCFGCLLL